MIIEAISEELTNQRMKGQFKVVQKDVSIRKIIHTQEITQIKIIAF
jgi:hypothetical protein